VSPIARAVRTFLSGLAAVAASAVAIDWVADYRVGAVVVGLGVLTSAVAAVAAFFLAVGDVTAETAVGKAVAQFGQMVGAGLATVTFSSIADLAPQGRVVATLLITSTVSALATFFMNAAEAHGEA
jgi:hypothetical protein